MAGSNSYLSRTINLPSNLDAHVMVSMPIFRLFLWLTYPCLIIYIELVQSKFANWTATLALVSESQYLINLPLRAYVSLIKARFRGSLPKSQIGIILKANQRRCIPLWVTSRWKGSSTQVYRTFSAKLSSPDVMFSQYFYHRSALRYSVVMENSILHSFILINRF